MTFWDVTPCCLAVYQTTRHHVTGEHSFHIAFKPEISYNLKDRLSTCDKICDLRLPYPKSEKSKVKVTLVQKLRLCTGRTARRGSRGIAIPFHDHGTRRRWGVSVTLRPLFTPVKTRYPLYRKLGGPQGRSGQVRKISHPPGFDPLTVQPVASRCTNWDTLPKNGLSCYKLL